MFEAECIEMFTMFLANKHKVKSSMKICKEDKDKIKDLFFILKKLNIDDLANAIEIGSGTYSKVFKISDYVIKIGFPHKNEKKFEHYRLIDSILKFNVTLTNGYFRERLGVEMQPYANTLVDITDDELYTIYKELRQSNLIWQDVKRENVAFYNGRLVVVDLNDICVGSDKLKKIFFTILAESFDIRYEKERNEFFNG